MPTLPEAQLAALLSPFLAGIPTPPTLLSRLSLYLDLLLRWNARTNLTAIREPEEIVTRHFGESLFAASLLPPDVHTVLDLGSGAGFPGIPLQLLRPDLAVTLAESQGKKAAFLREAVRSLHLQATVHADRAETLIPPAGSPAPFDCVALRAVDNMPAALATARALTRGPILAQLARPDLEQWASTPATVASIPLSTHRVVALLA